MDASDRRNRATEEAARWWVVLQQGATRSEREQFVDWLRESAMHVAEMLRIAQVHGALEQFQRWASLPIDGPVESARVVTLPARAPASAGAKASSDSLPRHPTRKRRTWWAAAAGIAVIAVLVTWMMPILRGQVIQTERGERREIALSDGSVVQIDPQSRLRIKFEPGRRLVFLDRGRALFRVASDAARPFEVHADGMRVRAIGTAFGVERKSSGIVVTVAEGKVAVLPQSATDWPDSDTAERDRGTGSAPQGEEKRSARAAVPAHSVVLSAGHQVTMARSGSVEPVREVNSHRELAWAQGTLIFSDHTLGEVLAQFNRYNRVQLRSADEELLNRRISAVFDASDLESFLAFVQTAAPVNVERVDEAIILSLRESAGSE